ncbi:MAG: hypothetical protein ERJ68_08470 [Aphanocapsa feldmannii 277cI]|uniref:Uncharacterized protein n=1 Tax=Aphanocapsa feldmannii 277cI TaxID=2507554 RepID=A0A524RSZ8_9CHRO|nr:MAG: hypothetical protein ERJ68_08470 [Aphanocapsa feldmannii 277cI]
MAFRPRRRILRSPPADQGAEAAARHWVSEENPCSLPEFPGDPCTEQLSSEERSGKAATVAAIELEWAGLTGPDPRYWVEVIRSVTPTPSA